MRIGPSSAGAADEVEVVGGWWFSIEILNLLDPMH